MKSKALVLLSGGLDSSVNLFEAYARHEIALALTFDYGQKAAASELKSSAQLCAHLKVPHQIVSLPFFKSFPGSSLLSEAASIPTGSAVNIESLSVSHQTAKSVWVPNRNGIFLNIGAGFAESLGAAFLIPGFNVEEAATFPDNSEDFMQALDQSLSFSTSNQVKVLCYTARLDKKQIVRRGLELHMPFEKIWPCYFSADQWCGRCESCQRSKRAMKAAGLPVEKYFKGAE